MFLDLFLTASLTNDYKLSDLKTIGISSILSGDRLPEVFEPESRCGQGGALAGAVCSRGSCPWPLLVAASILRLWPHHSRLCFCGHIAVFMCLSDLPLIRIPVVAFGAHADNLPTPYLSFKSHLPRTVAPAFDKISFPGSPLGGRFSARGVAVYASGNASGKAGPSGSEMSVAAPLPDSSALLSSGFTLRLFFIYIPG